MTFRGRGEEEQEEEQEVQPDDDLIMQTSEAFPQFTGQRRRKRKEEEVESFVVNSWNCH